jgi:pyridoxal phosphate enzyme (YggS family)
MDRPASGVIDTAMSARDPQIGERCDVESKFAAVRARIAEAAAAVGRDAGEVTLVAVAKLQPADRVTAALSAGHRVFGENRIQEAKAKWPPLKASFPDIVLHLVGPLQTNKVRDAVALFDVIETVDRPKLARALAAEMARSGRRPRCLVEVNTGAEPQKAGVLPEQADAFIEACGKEFGLPIAGLMCIPPMDEEPSLHFALLREIAKRHGLRELSMGMSEDFEIAVRFGATEVRLGTAVFGPRPPRRD